MFDFTSRYFSLETAIFTTENGADHNDLMMHHHEIAYKRRRFLPQGENLPLLVEYEIKQDDRLDVISAQTLGDPEQFWRICDANNTMNPIELTQEAGSSIRIPIPQA